jgi:hypothetical protein
MGFRYLCAHRIKVGSALHATAGSRNRARTSFTSRRLAHRGSRDAPHH